MPNKDFFLKKASFRAGKFNSGLIKDKKDDRDYKFSDLVKMQKTIKSTAIIDVSEPPKRGCYRKPNYFKTNPLHTVKTKVTVDKPLSLPWKRNHTSDMSPVKDQGWLGSCVAFGTVAMKEAQEKEEHDAEVAAGKKDNRQGKEYDYSEQWVYWNCKKIDSWPGEEGTDIRSAMKVLNKIGVPTEQAWPYTDESVNIGKPESWANLIARWATIDSYWRIESLTDLKTALLDSPVVIGVPVFEEWIDPEGGVISYPANPNDDLGGHAICIVSYNDNRERVKFKNSWGLGWGLSGYGYLSYRYINDFMWDAWVAKDIAVTREMLEGTRSLIG